jgi:hypothetical protein
MPEAQFRQEKGDVDALIARIRATPAACRARS